MRDFFKSGDFFIWLTGLGLGIALFMISGLLFLITYNSFDYLFPKKIIKVTLKDGNAYYGQIQKKETIPNSVLPDSLKDKDLYRIQLKIANRDLYGFDFIWIEEQNIQKIQDNIPEIVNIERIEFGNFFGIIKAIKQEETILYEQQNLIQQKLPQLIENASDLRKQITKMEKKDVGEINYNIEKLRLEIKKIQFYEKKTKISLEKIAQIEAKIKNYEKQYELLKNKIDILQEKNETYSIVVADANETEKTIPLSAIVYLTYPNNMNFWEKISYFLHKLTEFIFEEPRESNTEGGVFPAIFGTIMLVLLMSLVAVPFGVITALYLREYAKQGPVVRLVRIAVNNLAGVPSIVYGIFGLGFFIYTIGGTIDKLFYPELLPTPTWGTGGILWASLTLALLTVPVVIVATEEALATIPRGIREASLALGATKWQTIRRIVLPSATPGILTGLILAMARAAGEVAPLMITGVVKLAPSLPFDSNFPFFHLDRKFMHLGFHIYDVGFQSPNIEAAMPMVYMTTLLLIFIVVLLNITAIKIRNSLRNKYKSSTF